MSSENADDDQVVDQLPENSEFGHCHDIGRIGCTRPDRYLAAWMDAVFALLVVVCVSAVVGSYVPSSTSAALNVALGIAVGSVFFSYFLLFETVTSTTPGTFMFGLRVERLDGSRCSFRAALLRTITRVIEVDPIRFGCLIAAIVVRCSKRRQRWGDILAGTIVTDQPPRNPSRKKS